MAIEAIIGSELMQFGAFGALVVFYAVDKFFYHKDMKNFHIDMRQLVQNNTIALTRAYEELKRR